MSDTIIRVENLGKKYIIGHQQEERSHYVALRDVIADGVKSLLKTIQNPAAPCSRGGVATALTQSKSKIQNRYEEFWALKDVSFEVKQGEVIGIIGRNGAGKSTLLKILSRITEPTTGRIAIKGRVASLLEVGTGFHPELTGRENIYLNGAILGMSKAEIKKKFDEIVAFAEVEKFLDTPVKRYSSGMYVRLAFAVAAHLEPEILVVDEVLAVGDAAFQKKCLGKMGDVSTKEGRTVLFVSHNMSAVQTLCKKIIWLDRGVIHAQSYQVNSIVNRYFSRDQNNINQLEKVWHNFEQSPGNDAIKLKSLKVIFEPNKSKKITIKTSLKLEFIFNFLLEEALFYFGFHLRTIRGEVAFMATSKPQKTTKGLYKYTCLIPGELLNNCQYTTHLYWVRDGCKVLYEAEDLLRFEVEDVEREVGAWLGDYVGTVRPKLQWETELIQEILNTS